MSPLIFLTSELPVRETVAPHYCFIRIFLFWSILVSSHVSNVELETQQVLAEKKRRRWNGNPSHPQPKHSWLKKRNKQNGPATVRGLRNLSTTKFKCRHSIDFNFGECFGCQNRFEYSCHDRLLILGILNLLYFS
jgi:hypothetical protein